MTVVEWAEARIKKINQLIEDLQDERKMLNARVSRYWNSTMTEAERLATASEPFQTTQLPKEQS